MNEKTKAAVEASIALVKGWVRPLAFLMLTATMCAIALNGDLDGISWGFWAVYGGIGSVWIGEGTLNKLTQIKSSK